MLYHGGGSVASNKYQGNEFIGNMTRGLDSGVDLFFVISGFVIALPIFTGSQTTMARFLLGRVLRIYPMAALTAAIFILSGILVQRGIPERFVETVITSAFLLPAPYEPIPIVLWTLKQEMLFYVIFSLTFFRREAGLILVCFWGVTSFLIDSSHWFLLWFFHIQNIEFLFGVTACAIYGVHRPKRHVALAFALVGGVIFLSAAMLGKHLEISERAEVIILGLSAAALVYGTACLRIFNSDILMFCGAASYSIYLIHFFFISLANKVMARLPIHDAVALFVLFAASASLIQRASSAVVSGERCAMRPSPLTLDFERGIMIEPAPRSSSLTCSTRTAASSELRQSVS